MPQVTCSFVLNMMWNRLPFLYISSSIGIKNHNVIDFDFKVNNQCVNQRFFKRQWLFAWLRMDTTILQYY